MIGLCSRVGNGGTSWTTVMVKEVRWLMTVGCELVASLGGK